MKIAVLLVICSTVLFCLSSWAYSSRRRVGGAVELALFLLATGIYTVGYALEITSSELQDIFWALRLQFFGIPFLTLTFFLFAYRFVSGKAFRSGMTAVLIIIPLISLGLVLTVNRHSIFYSTAAVSYEGPFPVFSYSAGFWYPVHFIHLIIMSLAAEAVLLGGIIKSRGIKRKQTIMVFVSGIFPIISGVLTPQRFRGVDMQPFILVITGIFISIALFRFKMLELVPRARDLAVDSIDEILLVLDADLRIQDINESGQSSRLIGNLKSGDILPEKNKIREFLADIKEQPADIPGPHKRFEYENGVYDLKIHIISEQDKTVSGLVVIIRDITRTVELLKELERQAIHDDLTGLYNRRHIMNLATREIEMAQRNRLSVGIILMDIDYFKHINDSFGHLAGDMVLKRIAGILAREIRAIDLLGRYGGEEFIIICPHSDEAVTGLVAERLREAVEQMSIEFQGNTIRVTASFGIEAGEIIGRTNLTNLLSKADEALYEAKKTGRNRVRVFS